MRIDEYIAFFGRHKIFFTILATIVVGGIAFHQQTIMLAEMASWEGNDDAYISFRYAKNLAEGNGLVFNPGKERVEGYTNLLYTVAIGVGIMVAGTQWTYHWSLVLNLVAMGILMVIIGRSRHLSLTAKVGGILLAGLTPALAYWATSGLETIPVVAVQVGIVLLTEEISRLGQRRKTVVGLGTLCVISVFLRADGFLIPLLCVVYLTFRQRQTAIKIGGVTAVAMITMFGWRYWYYGDLLPMTYYAKVSGSLVERLQSARDVLSVVIWQSGLYIPLAILTAATVWHLWRKQGRFWSIPFRYWFTGAWVGYWFYVGGDIYHERFLVPLFPLAWITLCEFTRWVMDKTPPIKRRLQTCLVASMLALVVITPHWVFYERLAANNSTGWSLLGQMLKREKPDAVLAVDAAGKSPFFSGLQTIDMFGLNDKHIGRLPVEEGKFILGHSKTDLEYVLSKKPDFIASWLVLEGSADPSTMKMANTTLEEFEKVGYQLHRLVTSNSMQSINPPENESDWTIALLRGFDYGLLKRQDIRLAAGN